jgi:glycosyltransferase involved in cell wall biosynthesis
VWLFVDGASEFGGHEVMLIRWLQEIQFRGYPKCQLLARQGSRLEQHGRGFLFVDTFKPEGSSRWQLTNRLVHLWTTVCDAVKLWRTLVTLRPSLCIIAEGFVCRTPVYALIARLWGVRVAVYTPVIDGSRAMRFRFAWLRDCLTKLVYANMPDAWITITDAQAERFARWAHVRRPIFTLCNTVSREIERQANLQQYRAPKTESGRLNVMVLGRLDSHQKGLDLLLDYLEDAAAMRELLHVNIVGEGYYKGEIQRRLARSTLLSTLVSLHPWEDNPAEMIKRNDVLLIPSRYEGVPLVMLEAMCLGLPVVSSDLPGTRTFLPPECLFPVGSFARAFEITLKLGRTQLRREIITRNAEMFRTNASHTAFGANVNRLTDQLLGITARRGTMVTRSTHSLAAPDDYQGHNKSATGRGEIR